MIFLLLCLAQIGPRNRQWFLTEQFEEEPLWNHARTWPLHLFIGAWQFHWEEGSTERPPLALPIENIEYSSHDFCTVSPFLSIFPLSLTSPSQFAVFSKHLFTFLLPLDVFCLSVFLKKLPFKRHKSFYEQCGSSESKFACRSHGHFEGSPFSHR